MKKYVKDFDNQYTKGERLPKFKKSDAGEGVGEKFVDALLFGDKRIKVFMNNQKKINQEMVEGGGKVGGANSYLGQPNVEKGAQNFERNSN